MLSVAGVWRCIYLVVIVSLFFSGCGPGGLRLGFFPKLPAESVAGTGLSSEKPGNMTSADHGEGSKSSTDSTPSGATTGSNSPTGSTPSVVGSPLPDSSSTINLPLPPSPSSPGSPSSTCESSGAAQGRPADKEQEAAQEAQQENQESAQNENDCENQDSVQSAQQTSQEIYELWRLTNQFRVKNQLSPLSLNQKLSRAAQKHAMEMANKGFFDHVDPDGRTFGDRIRQEGFYFAFAGENISLGYPTAQKALSAWILSPPHRENLMNNKFTEIGLGYFVARGRAYWVQDFGIKN